MRIRIVKTVPGYVCGRSCNPGDEVTVPAGVAVSLVADGYAEVIRGVPAEQRETATVKRAGRPRKGG